MVERDRAVLATLRRSRAALGAAAVEIVAGDADEYLARAGERFDVVFLDPPFRQNADAALLGRLAPRLQGGARVDLEAAQAAHVEAPWHERKRARAGRVSCQLLTWEPA
jgi:16S rRNA (guanine966-N2)-methyltransferase